MARPSSASKPSRLATSTTLIPAAAICRANSLPIPDEAPVTSAQGPNRSLSSAAFIVLFLSVDCTCCSIVQSHSADPIFQALYLHRHQVGVISGVRHRSHTLKSTEEMHGKFSCILFMAGRPESLLETTMRYLAPATDVHDELDLVTIPSVGKADPAPRKSAARETRSLRKGGRSHALAKGPVPSGALQPGI